jgi:uncharacterized repeat protein (TIGR01451 family)
MNGLLKSLVSSLRTISVGILCLSMPAASWAEVTNTATATYSDAGGAAYTATSNTVSTVTPPVITSAGSDGANVGVPYSYRIQATNTPSTFGATGLPAGLSVNSGTGMITGTPTTAGTFTIGLSAVNSAGTGTKTLLLTVSGAPNIVLTKSSDKTTANAGTVITYTIQVQNTGAGAATNVIVRDTVPTGTTLVGGSITAGGSVSSGVITWNLGTIAAGAPVQSVSFKVTVN